MINVIKLSRALDAYMRFRAGHEGVGYELSPEFFEQALRRGVRECFGVTFDANNLVKDRQQPALLKQWKATQ